MAESLPISTGVLLIWTGSDPERIGVVATVEAGGRRVTVRLDDGELGRPVEPIKQRSRC
jgi:hypothetical protein